MDRQIEYFNHYLIIIQNKLMKKKKMNKLLLIEHLQN